MKKHNQKKIIPVKDPDQEALEAKVDAMLDPSLEGDVSIKTEAPLDDTPTTAPEIDDAALEEISDEAVGLDNAAQELASPDSLVEDKSVSQVAEAESLADSETAEGDEAAPDFTARSPEQTSEIDVSDQTTSVLEPAEFNSVVLDDDLIDRAIDDIAAEDSDKLLAAEDTVLRPVQSLQPQGGRLRRFFIGWWKSPTARWLTFGFIVAVLAAAALLPASRYYFLNSFGVRSKASAVVIDQSTQQPLKNVKVTVHDVAAYTDDSGAVYFEDLPLGPTIMAIEKRAFSPLFQNVTVGWGSNPFGSFDLEPVGSQFVFSVLDYVSGEPITAAAARSEYADANADEAGNITLTLDAVEDVEILVEIEAPGYRAEAVVLDTSKRQQNEVVLVPSNKHSFISNRAGKFDLFSIDIDGKNEQLVLAGTGDERSDLELMQHPAGRQVALVSTRDNQRNEDGYLLSSLFIVDIETKNIVKVTTSEQIRLIGWSGDQIAYVQIAAGASAANPNRQRLMVFNSKLHENRQLASANYFNSVLAIRDKIYYAGSSGNAFDSSSHFTQITFDGVDKKTLLPAQTWNAFRTAYDTLVLSTPDMWYSFDVSQGLITELPGQPSDTTQKFYLDNNDGSQSLWLDYRDGKGTLVVRDNMNKTERTILSDSGASRPARWLNDTTILYRMKTDRETADYVVSIIGGPAKKIVDVYETGSTDRWYYY